MTPKQIHDMEELIPGNPIDRIHGSDIEEPTTQDEIALHEKNMLEAYETDINAIMKEADPCCGRYCNECEIGGCTGPVRV